MSYTSKKPCTISASDEFDCIEICGKFALFTDERLTPSDVPAGMHLYHLRQTDDGRDFATLEQTVFVNHGGSVLVREPIDLGKDGYVVLNDDTAPNSHCLYPDTLIGTMACAKCCIFGFKHEFRICKVKFRHYAFHYLFFCDKYDIIIMSLFV